MKLVDGNLSEEEQLALEELHQYLLLGDGCWALSDIFLVFVGRILNDPQVSTEARVHLLRALASAALKDDIILLLHQDRRDHVMMNYMLEIEKIKPEEQQALALFVSHTNAFFHNRTNHCCPLRLATCLRTWMHQNGFFTSASGLTTTSKHQTFVPLPKWWFIHSCRIAQSFRNSGLLWPTTWASRK